MAKPKDVSTNGERFKFGMIKNLCLALFNEVHSQCLNENTNRTNGQKQKMCQRQQKLEQVATVVATLWNLFHSHLPIRFSFSLFRLFFQKQYELNFNATLRFLLGPLQADLMFLSVLSGIAASERKSVNVTVLYINVCTVCEVT